jgi:hypothetical protein
MTSSPCRIAASAALSPESPPPATNSWQVRFSAAHDGGEKARTSSSYDEGAIKFKPRHSLLPRRREHPWSWEMGFRRMGATQSFSSLFPSSRMSMSFFLIPSRMIYNQKFKLA